MHAFRPTVIALLVVAALGIAAASRPLAQTRQAPPLPKYPIASTALLVVDPYNDFLSDGGKAWPATKETARTQGLIEHMQQALAAARAANLRHRSGAM